MPKSSKAKLEYMKEYLKKPEIAERGVERRKARRHAIAEGRVAIGDGKDIDHRTPLDKGGSNARSNQRVVSEAKNRSWRKDHPDMYGKNK